MCCTLRGDLIRENSRIRQQQFDYVLVECTGTAEPQQVAQAFVYDPSTEQLAKSEQDMLWTQTRLDTCVAVVDAHSFPTQLSSLQQFGERYDDGMDKDTPEVFQEGEKSIATLLMELVKFANVILLDKTDLVSKEEQEETNTPSSTSRRLSIRAFWHAGRDGIPRLAQDDSGVHRACRTGPKRTNTAFGPLYTAPASPSTRLGS